MQDPWFVGGDFNIITREEEKLGGLLVTVAETKYFKHCINMCKLEDARFKGSKFTWWNGRMDKE